MEKLINSLIRLVEKSTKAKLLTLFIIAIMLVILIYINFDFFTSVTFDFKNTDKAVSNATSADDTKEDADRAKVYTALRLKEIQLTPVAFSNMPSYFFIELRNEGGEIAKEVEIIIDFGKSSLSKYEISSANTCNTVNQTKDKSRLIINCKSISIKSSVYIYSFLTIPTFRNIVVNYKDTSDTTRNALNYAFRDYEHSSNETSFYEAALKFIGFVLVVIIAGSLAIIVISFAISIWKD